MNECVKSEPDEAIILEKGVVVDLISVLALHQHSKGLSSLISDRWFGS